MSDGCPWKETTDFARHCFELHGDYAEGHLLYAGGISEQPLWYRAAMRRIAKVQNEYQREKMEDSGVKGQ